MALRGLPHTLTVALPAAVIQDNVLKGHGDDPQGTVQGLLYSVCSGTMFERFNVNTSRGHAFLCDPEHAPKFVEGGRATLDGRTFAVKGAPLVIADGGRLDNAEVPLEEVD